ncbi:MmgE/PrpD family protein [Tropicimonas sp. IMCC34043]|uniref:MmgE/PrpD family protein n=1 Tax=Tropicimonas sp. IMCC34043 TaxID=2248760 RepID=UPI000E277DBD|nr:MmgE/PrpD family protein [Tropicimonas sp. IMCC34043]
MIPVTMEMARVASGFSLDDQPAEAVKWARRSVADVIACMAAGHAEPVVRLLLGTLPLAGGPSTVVGTATGRSALDAAQVNGVAAHALDFDDCNLLMDGHPSVSVVPALFALAEARGATGADLLAAYMAGVTTEIWLARMSNPEHVNRGWHPTVTFGVVGCAAAGCRLLRLDPETTARALAVAASAAAGVRANSGTMTKPLHAGMANRNGLQAVLLAEAGMTANTTAFEHKLGYLQAFNGRTAGEIDRAALEPPAPGEAFLSPGIAIKQYPCCAFIHSAIDAATALRGEMPSGAIPETITVRLHPRRLRNIDRPTPCDELDARFSTQYLVARALLHGTVGLNDFQPDALGDGQTQEVMRRIDLATHDCGDLNLGRIAVTLPGGARHEASASIAMGRGRDNPLSEDEFRRKFDDCCTALMTPADAAMLYDGLMALETQSAVTGMTCLLAARGGH